MCCKTLIIIIIHIALFVSVRVCVSLIMYMLPAILNLSGGCSTGMFVWCIINFQILDAFLYLLHFCLGSSTVMLLELHVCLLSCLSAICHMHSVSSDLRLPSGGIVFQKISFYQGLFHMAYFYISCVMVIVYGMCCNL